MESHFGKIPFSDFGMHFRSRRMSPCYDPYLMKMQKKFPPSNSLTSSPGANRIEITFSTILLTFVQKPIFFFFSLKSTPLRLRNWVRPLSRKRKKWKSWRKNWERFKKTSKRWIRSWKRKLEISRKQGGKGISIWGKSFCSFVEAG